MHFTRYVFSLLFGLERTNGGTWPKWLERDFQQVPFEVVMQNYPDRNAIRQSIQDIFGISDANRVHELFAEALSSGNLRSLITTNYDLCLDAEFEKVGGISKIWDKRTWEVHRDRLHGSSAVYWKIHGTAKAGELDSLVIDLSTEGRMDEWKQELLAQLLKDKSLVIVGYSGRDFEICPALAYHTRPRHVIWLQPTNVLTPNGRRVLSEQRGTLAIGDLQDFLPKLFFKQVDIGCGTRKFDLQVDSRLIPEWRARILEWMACGRLALPEIKALSDSRVRSDLLIRTYGHLGRYRDSVRELEKQITDGLLDRHDKLQVELSVASSRFILGSHWKGWTETLAIERDIIQEDFSDLRLAVIEQKLMMVMRFKQITRLPGIRLLTNFLERKIAKDYEKGRDQLERMGAWGRLQALRLNAQRIGISTEREMALSPLEGYASLGAIGMLSIAVRDIVRTAGQWHLSRAKRLACLWGIRTARRYGWTHEEWKYRWMLLIRGGGRFRRRHYVSWWRCFRITQYTWIGRLVNIVNATIPQRF